MRKPMALPINVLCDVCDLSIKIWAFGSCVSYVRIVIDNLVLWMFKDKFNDISVISVWGENTGVIRDGYERINYTFYINMIISPLFL
jgi:hypothetical protein